MCQLRQIFGGLKAILPPYKIIGGWLPPPPMFLRLHVCTCSPVFLSKQCDPVLCFLSTAIFRISEAWAAKTIGDKSCSMYNSGGGLPLHDSLFIGEITTLSLYIYIYIYIYQFPGDTVFESDIFASCL